MLNRLLNLLDGKKTYLGAAIVFIAAGLQALGKINASQEQTMVVLGGSIATVGLRSALKKLE